MKKTWKPIVASVLVIVVGCYMISFLAPVFFIGGGMYPTQWKVMLFYVLPLALVILGVMAMSSGAFSSMRKLWRFAIAGSVCEISASITVTALNRMVLSAETSDGLSTVLELIPAFLALPALVLLVLSRKEFVPVKSELPTPHFPIS